MTNLNTPFMIGNVEIPNRTVLAPMAGVTNSAFRTIAKELGAGLVVMEMVSDKGIQYNNEKTLHMLHIDEGENPVSIQLFGSDEDKVKVAGGFLLQVLPNAKEEEIARFEKRIQEMPAISTLLESEDHIEALLKAIYGDEPFKRLSEEEIRFQCDCSRERFLNALASLPASDLKEMKDEDHGAEITCQFCQTHYHFDENDLEELIRDKS